MKVKKMKNNFWNLLLCSLIMSWLLTSCSKTNFVLKMHNNLINEFKLKGVKSYSGVEYYMTDSAYYCKLERKFEKLNSIVPNPNFSHFLCDFQIDFNYIVMMREFVQNNNSKSLKLDKLSEFEFNKIDSKFDSLWIIENNYLKN